MLRLPALGPTGVLCYLKPSGSHCGGCARHCSIYCSCKLDFLLASHRPRLQRSICLGRRGGGVLERSGPALCLCSLEGVGGVRQRRLGEAPELLLPPPLPPWLLAFSLGVSRKYYFGSCCPEVDRLEVAMALLFRFLEDRKILTFPPLLLFCCCDYAQMAKRI